MNLGICNSVQPVGAVECLKKLGKARYIIIDDLSVSFSGNNDLASSVTNKAFINEPDADNLLKSYIFKLTDYEVGTADPTVTTFENTRQVIIDKPIPTATAYADLSFCDQQHLVKTLQGGTYRVRIVTADNEMLAYKTSVGTIKGFKAEIMALTKGLPQKADVDKNVTIYMNFASYEEFEKTIVVKPTWSIGSDLSEATPIGLNMSQESAYATGEVTVQVSERCSGGQTGLVSGDFVVIDSNVTTPTITAVEVSGGVYTLTVQKETTTDLASGDIVIFQVQNKTGDIANLISNQVELIV